MSKYEQYKSNNLESFVKKDPFEKMKDLFGEKYVKYRESWKGAHQYSSSCVDFPLHIDIDLKDACNQSCAMCHQKYRSRSGVSITWDLLKTIIDEGAQNGLCAINFGSSAEPLLNKELLLKGIIHARDSGIMDIFIHTNAVLLDEKISHQLVESGLRHICISVDAATANTYQKSRNSDLFEKILTNIENLIKIRDKKSSCFPTVRVSFCINPTNYKEKDIFLERWKNKADLVEFQGFRHVSGTPEPGIEFEKTTVTCSNPFRRLMIWPEGDVTLCCGYRFPDVILGNVLDHSIRSLWHSEKMDRIRESFKTNQGLPETCAKCLVSNYQVRS